MRDPICKNLIEEELAGIKGLISIYEQDLENFKKGDNNRDVFIQHVFDIKKTTGVLQDRMSWLLENSRDRLSRSDYAIFNEFSSGVQIDGQDVKLDKNIFSIVLNSNIGEVEIKVGDKYEGATEGNNFSHRVIGFDHSKKFILLEKRIRLAGGGINGAIKKTLIISKVETFFDNFWKR